MKKNNNGFTLVELIVVITIIMIVSVAGLVNFGGVSNKSRDSKRVADLEKIRVALEMIRQVGVTYPTTTGAPPTVLVPDYMSAIPLDPKSPTFTYRYTPGANYYTYSLDAHMEDLGSTNGNFGAGCGGTCNYRVTNP